MASAARSQNMASATVLFRLFRAIILHWWPATIRWFCGAGTGTAIAAQEPLAKLRAMAMACLLGDAADGGVKVIVSWMVGQPAWSIIKQWHGIGLCLSGSFGLYPTRNEDWQRPIACILDYCVPATDGCWIFHAGMLDFGHLFCTSPPRRRC